MTNVLKIDEQVQNKPKQFRKNPIEFISLSLFSPVQIEGATEKACI